MYLQVFNTINENSLKLLLIKISIVFKHYFKQWKNIFFLFYFLYHVITTIYNIYIYIYIYIYIERERERERGNSITVSIVITTIYNI